MSKNREGTPSTEKEDLDMKRLEELIMKLGEGTITEEEQKELSELKEKIRNDIEKEKGL